MRKYRRWQASAAFGCGTTLQEEDAALPHETSNRNEQQLFQEHPRPGLEGELLGDCRLNANVGGQGMWQVGCSLGLREGRRCTACSSLGLPSTPNMHSRVVCVLSPVPCTPGWQQESSFGKGGQKWLYQSFRSTAGGKLCAGTVTCMC